LDEPKFKEKMDSADREALEKAVEDALQWLDKNQMAETEEFEAKQKEVEAVANPIMAKAYQATGGAPDMGGADIPAGGGAGPTVEEVD